MLLFRNDEVLLLLRQNTGYEDGRYSVVAGHVEPGETALDGMRREAEEEAGLILTREQLRLCHVIHRRTDAERISLFFTADDWRGEPRNNEPQKCGDLSWFPLDALPHNMIPYVRQAIQETLRGTVYSEHGWTESSVSAALS
ncbi:NUDIX hydrolase [Solimonas marina]|uniref:NUDIX hydrolase n=1 Tax=Solimonas marina TaxID=2714601 RepID=UPI0019D14BCE|nr:NUDIX domain-containing protein [Solimonas marina]